jgi:Uma2 family endonuclease
MTNFNQTNITGNAHNLMHHLGNFETTLVAGEHYMARTRPREMTGVRYPDLLVAFGVNPEAYRQSNAYIIDEQGKPPDFVMEIASPSTRDQDATVKRREYEALGIPEYWRFDEKGDSHRAKLAGDRLVDGRYEPVPIDEQPDGTLQGYSQALGLLIRWNEGQLQWIDPSTEDRIPSLQTEREGRLAEQEGRLAAERGRDAEREARLATEAQLRELQAELELRNNNP